MAVNSSLSPTELENQVTSSYVDKSFEVALINSPGTSYQPGVTVDATFLSNEVTTGLAGYQRQVIRFAQSDVAGYSDGGVGLNLKAAVFAHDGGANTYNFTHVCLLRGSGDVDTLNSPTTRPASGTDGTYTSIPTTTGGSGLGATLNITVANSGAADGDWTVEISNPGYGYNVGEDLTVSNAVLAAAGVTASGTGSLTLTIAAIGGTSNSLISVAPTSSTIIMSDGNEAVFYYNIKHFGA